MEQQAASDGRQPLFLEGYHFLSWIGETPLAYLRLYEEASSGIVVVAKEIRPEICGVAGFAEAFEERISRLVDMQHPNLLPLIAHGKTAEGGIFVIREREEGVTLREWMQRGEPVDAATAALIVTSVASALEAFHERDVVYGSLSPSRVWIGDDYEIQLEVFPVATLLEPDHLVRLMGLKEISAFPPEMLSGGVASVQGDIFSLGALHFELLTGVPPHGAITRMPPVTGLDVRVGHAILKALSAEPSQRQASTAAYLAPLEAMHGAPAPEAANLTQDGARTVMRGPVMTVLPALIILTLVVSVSAIGWYIWKREHAPSGADIVSLPAKNDPPSAWEKILAEEEASPPAREEAAAPLVLVPPDADTPPSASNPVALDIGMISRLRQSEPEQKQEAEPEEKTEIYRLPAVPAPLTTSGDAYIYAAHFYLGEETGLLKLEFGNAGVYHLTSSRLAFQCAFSIDGRLDDLVPAGSGEIPSFGLDVAAGGFSTDWLGLEEGSLMPGKKHWMRHTFRIDVSDPEIRATAKYLVIKISPHYLIGESNYLNNEIAVPLEYPNVWHSVTQDPADAVKPKEEGAVKE